MDKPWYEMNVPEEDKRYDEAVMKIKSGVLEGSLSFGEASARIGVPEGKLRDAIVLDALKVLIAETHFGVGTPLAELAGKLGLTEGNLQDVKAEMLGEVEAAAIEKYRAEAGQDRPSGNA